MGNAWQTLQKVGIEIGVIPDGSTIHFKFGGTYRGNVAFSGRSDLTFIADWGSGDPPVLSGAILIPNGTWQASSACFNCYEVPLAQVVQNLYVNTGATSQLQTLARYPNVDAPDNGWMRTDQYGSFLIEDNDLPARPNGYWTGTNVVLRVANWAHEVASIIGYDDGLKELYLGTPVSLPINSPSDGWGFFLVNTLAELDHEGEWFYDGTTLYFHAPGSGTPQDVEVSVWETGFSIQNSNAITFQGLVFEKHSKYEVESYLSNGILVQNCTFRHTRHGIKDDSGGDPLNHSHQYLGNTFTEVYGTALRSDAYDAEIIGNTFLNIGLWPGLAEPDFYALGAIGIKSGSGAKVEYNRLENIGYMGITTVGTNGSVRYNLVRNALRTLNDGGGISFDDCDGLDVTHNIIDGLGHPDNLISTSVNSGVYHQIGPGIYFGDNVITNTLVEWNTVAGCERGILVDHTFDSQGNVIQNNTLFGNEVQLALSDYSNCNGFGGLGCGGGQGTGINYQAAYDDRYHRNIMYCTTADQKCMGITNAWAASWADVVDFGTFTDNYYFNAFSDLSVWIHKYWDHPTDGDTDPDETTFPRTFLQWQRETFEDQDSHTHPQHLKDYLVIDPPSGTPLVGNGTFTSNVIGWDWSAACAQWTASGINGGSLTTLSGCEWIAEPFYNPNYLAGDYELKFKIQGSANTVMYGYGQSGPGSIGGRWFEVRTEPREVVLPITIAADGTGYVEFRNAELSEGIQDMTITLDDVSIMDWDVEPDPDVAIHHILLYNDHPLNTINVSPTSAGCWSDVYGNIYADTDQIPLDPFESIVLFKLNTAYEIDQTTYTIPTGTPEIWDYDKNVRGSVIVPNGATLIVDHATIGFADSRLDGNPLTNVVVQPGGTMTLRNGALFNSVPGDQCMPSMWDGAKALGNGTTIGAGLIAIESGSGITDAICAVLCADGDPMNPLLANNGTGGIVVTADAYFENNKVDLVARPHGDIDPLVWGPSSFTNTRFARTRPLRYTDHPIHWPLAFGGAHTDITNAANTAFLGCSFGNAAGVAHLNPGHWPMFGIAARNTQVKVDENPVSQRRSSFTAMKRGLIHTTSDASKVAIVNAADFSGNVRGLVFAGSANSRVTLCTFNVPDIDPIWAPGFGATFGTYLWNCKGFEFEENTFKGSGNTHPKVGAIFNTCGPDFNQFYNNKFNGFTGYSPQGYSAGTIIMGDNYDEPPGTDEGLHIKCNDYSTEAENDYDIAFTDADPSIAKFQGSNLDQLAPAGNTFKIVSQDVDPGCTADPEQHLYVELLDINEFVYWHHTEQLGVVELRPHCASDPPILTEGFTAWLKDGGFNYVKPTVCPQDLSPVPAAPNTPNEIIDAEEELTTLEEVYGDWSNGGNTTGLLDFINDPANSSYAVRNELMLVAPSVDYTAWRTAFERTPPMNPWHMAQALIANSPLDPSVIGLMNTYGMDSYFRELVEGAQNGGTSMHTIYGSDISHFRGKQAEGLRDLTSAALAGNSTTALQAALTMHQQHPGSGSAQSELALHLALGDLAAARGLVDDNLTTSNVPEYWQVQDLYLDLLENELGPEDVNGNDLASLQAIAASALYGAAHAKAWLMLLGDSLTEHIVLPRPLGQRSSIAHRSSSASQPPGTLEVHPNPSNGPVYIVAQLPEGAETGLIRVMDPLGRLVLERRFTGPVQIIDLDGYELASGFFTVGLSADGIAIGMAKFEVLR